MMEVENAMMEVHDLAATFTKLAETMLAAQKRADECGDENESDVLWVLADEARKSYSKFVFELDDIGDLGPDF